jgi:hypothetical protein
MKKSGSLFLCFFLCLFLSACFHEKEEPSDHEITTVHFEEMDYQMNNPLQMEKLLRSVLKDETTSFSKIGFYLPDDSSYQFPAIIAYHTNGELHFTSVLPLENKEAHRSEGAVYVISCVMQCTSKSYCTDCIQRVISECKILECNCDGQPGCQSSILFL